MDHIEATITGRLRAFVLLQQDRPFCHHYVGGEAEIVSYGALLAGAEHMARGFYAAGLAQGEVVLLFLKHEPELYAVFLGAMLAGLVPSFMPYPSPKQDLDLFWTSHRLLLARIRPALVVVSDGMAAELGRNLLEYAERIRPLSELPRRTGPVPMPLTGPDTIALLQHSSGTTALKKGVMLSHGAVLRQVDAYADSIGLGIDDRIASWLPLYHDMGLIACLMGTLLRGATLVALDPFEWVSRPMLLLDAIERHRATFCWMPNFAFNHLAINTRQQPGRDLSSVRGFINCSEPCQPASFAAFVARLSEAGVTPECLQLCYAMAENVFAVTQTALGRLAQVLQLDRAAFETEHRVVPGSGVSVLSCGRPIHSVRLRIVDKNGIDLPEGHVGEVAIHSDFLFNGYYQRKDLTARKLRAGWYYSGDLGFLHEGELYISGRVDDLVIAYGRNYYAHEIEGIAMRVAGVTPGRCVVFGVPSPRVGTQQVVLLAEVRGEPAPELVGLPREAVLADTGLALASVELCPPGTLVKTTSGKISRTENRLRFLSAKGLLPHGTG